MNLLVWSYHQNETLPDLIESKVRYGSIYHELRVLIFK